MKNDYINESAKKFELPLKEGAWENIQIYIPTYKKNKRILPFIITFAILIGISSLYIGNKFFDKNKSQYSRNKINSAFLNEKKNKIKTNENNVNTQQLKNNSLKKNNSNNTKKKSEIFSNKSDKAIKVIPDIKFKKNNNKSLDGFNKNNKLNEIQLNTFVSSKDKLSTYFNYDSINFDLNDVSTSYTLNIFGYQKLKLKNANTNNSFERFSLKINKYKYNHYVSFAYTNYVTSFILSPVLMKIPKGVSNEIELGAGKNFKRLSLGANLSYSNVNQTTIMPGNHDTSYRASFRPNFKTLTPTEYAYKIHDTNNLILPGTNKNFINQQFILFGFGVNSSYSLINLKKFSVDIGYSFNYKLLKKARTFFWDSINNFAIPFTEKEDKIVFHNLYSSRINAAIRYKINNHFHFQVSPSIEFYHTPFVKHYYKVKMQNSGVRFNLIYNF